MADRMGRKERLHHLLDLARAYRGWSRAELARALNRDATRLYADTDDPKIGFVVSLADVLEWPVDAAVEYIWAGVSRQSPAPDGAADFESAERDAKSAYVGGNYAQALECTRRLFALAGSSDERARAGNLEYVCWDALGRYTKALNAVRAALREPISSVDLRLILQSNLANAYYTLGDLTPACGTAQALLEWFADNTPENRDARVTQAFAYYVRGNVFRRLIENEPADRARHAARAHDDLQLAVTLNQKLADELGREDLAGIANTCRGALVEVDVELSRREPEQAVDELLEGLEPTIEPEQWPAGDLLQSYGWWCIFGGNIALRALTGRALQKAMAIFMNKALEIAERLDNWAFRERVFTMEYKLRERVADSTGFELDVTIDDDDIRLIAGTMGRFPAFRDLGWDILRTAKVVKNARRN